MENVKYGTVEKLKELIEEKKPTNCKRVGEESGRLVVPEPNDLDCRA